MVDQPAKVLRSNGLEIFVYYLVIIYGVYFTTTILFSFLPLPATLILLYFGYNKHVDLVLSKDNFESLYEKILLFIQNFWDVAFDSYQNVRNKLNNLNTNEFNLKREDCSRIQIKFSDDEVKALIYKFRNESIAYLKTHYYDTRLLTYLGPYASKVKYLYYEPEAKLLYHTAKEMCISFNARFNPTILEEFNVKAIFNLDSKNYTLKFVKLQNESTWEEIDFY